MIFDLVVRPHCKPKQQKLRRGTAGQVPDSQAASETYDYFKAINPDIPTSESEDFDSDY